MRYRTENQITLVWIRHGETKANQEQRYLGRTDEDLSEKGIETLLSYKKQNFYPKVTHLFTSPMKRCVETGAVLYPELSPVVIPEWREMDFGQFEYKNYEELKDDVRYQAWIDSGGALDFPGGESRENFILRCEKGFLKMCGELQQLAGQNGKEAIRAGIIVHGGTIMALFSSYGGHSYFDYQVPNGRGYICRMEGWPVRTVPGKKCVRIKEMVRI